MAKGARDDLGLPKTALSAMVGEHLPADLRLAPAARDLVAACAAEFIHLLGSEANETAERDGRSTITPVHVHAALTALGFSAYAAAVQAELQRAKVEETPRSAKPRNPKRKWDAAGMSEEEAIAEQKRLLAEAKSRMEGGGTGGQAAGGGAGGGVAAPGAGPSGTGVSPATEDAYEDLE